MTFEEIIAERGIEEVVHFTWHKGLVGMLHSGFVKSRARLPKEIDLEFIYKPNAPYRKDLDWIDFVNLSISRINSHFFRYACKWHRNEDLWWCVLSFTPEILSHPGVWFVTTNNIYPAAARAQGPAGLESLFADEVTGINQSQIRRPNDLGGSITTCEQAEVLYPNELSLDYLRKIYVATGEDQDDVSGMLQALGKTVDVVISPDMLSNQGVARGN